MVAASQDARPGRTFGTALECYSQPTPGSQPGTFTPAYGLPFGTCGSLSTAKTGSTLAQNLAPVDILVIPLGTNDILLSTPIGTPIDAADANTFYGNMRWVVETVTTAKPGIRIIFVTAQYLTGIPPTKTAAYVNAEVAYGASVGVPVINMAALGGVNANSAGTLLRDGIHPSDPGFARFFGPVVAQGIQAVN